MMDPEAAPDNRFEIVSEDGLRATINPEGGYVESLQTISGSHLIFPRADIDGKNRGGVFACAPIFGRGDRVGLKQHGFARNLGWQVMPGVDQNSTHLSQFIDGNEAPSELQPYAGCRMDLTITVDMPEHDQAWLQMNLRIMNGGRQPFVVAPGFHPYFPIETSKNAQDIIFQTQQKDGTLLPMQFSVEELKASQLLVSPEAPGLLVQFQHGNYDIEIGSRGLLSAVVWSDNPERYVCFEPTAAGPAASPDSDASLDPYSLNPGIEREYWMEIHWSRREKEPKGPTEALAAVALK